MSDGERAIDTLLKGMMERKASDLHLTAGSPPIYRVHGKLIPVDHPPLTPEQAHEMVSSLLTPAQQRFFEQRKELDFSYSLPGVCRYRGNALLQRGTVGAVFRVIPDRVQTLDDLGFPPVLKELCRRPRGLVLVTGPTGSGKSTTLAAMIEHINQTEGVHIVTIEDPIEFLYKNKRAVIRQREVGGDTHSFAEALKYVLRQDPDVILVGEMRDLETIALTITAAETGHLVFGTLHTTGAAASIDRVIDVFPAHQQQQVRMQMSIILEGVISQALVPTVDGSSRVCAMEVMMATTPIRTLIREGKVHQMPNVIQSSSRMGMITLERALKNLVKAGTVTLDDAILKVSNPEDFARFCGQE